MLGPPEGRYLVRPPLDPEADPSAGAERPLAAILVLRSLAAPPRARRRGRRGRMVEEIAPAAPATTRATVIRPEPFGGAEEAERWLAGLRRDDGSRDAAIDAALAVVSRALQAYRIAAADPSVAAVTAERALVVRLGYGDGEAVADGLAERALELPSVGRRRRLRSMEAPEERFAAILGGRTPALASEELVLRARADVRDGRMREAALEARIALEALLAELPLAGAELADVRRVVADAANAALRGPLPEALDAALRDALALMERCLRNRRLTT